MSVLSSLADVLPAEALGEPGGDSVVLPAAHPPDAVVRPASTEEVVELLRWAGEAGVGVLPLASGVRVRPPRAAGRYVALCTRRLSGIEIYESADVTLTARAGTPVAELAEALARHAQWLPFDPPDVVRRSLGGLVASGESGPLQTGYGALRNHVLGATVVTGDGRTLRLGGRVVKNVAGFDLLRPLVGSRGRLGVLTSVCVRAFPVPSVDRLLVLRRDDLEGLRAPAKAVRTAPVLPASAVLLRPLSGTGSGGAALLLRLHGSEATLGADQAALERHLGVGLEVSSGPGRDELQGRARDLGATGDVVLSIAVPPSRLLDALAAADRVAPGLTVSADAYNGLARVAGGAGQVDGLMGLKAQVEALGGTVTPRLLPEGVDPAALASLSSPAEVQLAWRLERTFDPGEVLWPCRP